MSGVRSYHPYAAPQPASTMAPPLRGARCAPPPQRATRANLEGAEARRCSRCELTGTRLSKRVHVEGGPGARVVRAHGATKSGAGQLPRQAPCGCALRAPPAWGSKPPEPSSPAPAEMARRPAQGTRHWTRTPPPTAERGIWPGAGARGRRARGGFSARTAAPYPARFSQLRPLGSAGVPLGPGTSRPPKGRGGPSGPIGPPTRAAATRARGK